MGRVTRTSEWSLVGDTDWYELERDEDGYYRISLTPYAPETAPMVDVEGTDVTGITFGALFFDTWSDLDDFSFEVRNAMNQIAELESMMRSEE